jgi:hypothetical protein
MGVVRDMFKAFVAAYLSERALDRDVVYHGRSGHLVLPDLTSVLRVRTIDDDEARIERVMARLKLSREKAKKYAMDVDEDRKRWVRRIYNTDWDDPALYDVTLNAAHLSTENAASVVLEMAQLPEFQSTPASRRVLQDILLFSRCRLAIGKDENTRNLSVTVQANRGFVSVTYPPHQADRAKHIPAVLERIEGIRSLVCTLATTNILYLGDHFDPSTPAFSHLVEIAEKWNAAVDLAQLREADLEAPEPEKTASTPVGEEGDAYDGGILSDTEPEGDVECAGGGVLETIDYLARVGRAGRFRCFRGGVPAMLKALSPETDYSLIVVGDVFSEKEKARVRMKRNAIALLSERFRVPVLASEELKSQYLFGPKQAMSLISTLGIAALIYFLVLNYQDQILRFLSVGHFSDENLSQLMAAVVVALVVPFVAFSVGTFYKNVLKLIKLE